MMATVVDNLLAVDDHALLRTHAPPADAVVNAAGIL